MWFKISMEEYFDCSLSDCDNLILSAEAQYLQTRTQCFLQSRQTKIGLNIIFVYPYFK